MSATASEQEIAEYNQLVLQRIKLCSRVEVGLETLHDVCENAKLKSFSEWSGERLVQTMYSYILGMREQRIEASWPANWVQAIKQRFAPEWFLNRWPVVTVGIDEPQFGAVYLSVYADKTSTYPDGKLIDVNKFGIPDDEWERMQAELPKK